MAPLTFSQIMQHITSLFRWWVLVYPWEQALRVRFGKHLRLLGAGLHLRIPVIDAVFKQTTRMRVVSLPPMTVTTKDKQAVTVTLSIGYTIQDLRKLYETLYNPETTIANIVMGRIATFISEVALDGCTPELLAESVSRELGLEKYGIGDGYVKVTGFAAVKTYRLIQDGHWVPDQLKLDEAS